MCNGQSLLSPPPQSLQPGPVGASGWAVSPERLAHFPHASSAGPEQHVHMGAAGPEDGRPQTGELTAPNTVCAYAEASCRACPVSIKVSPTDRVCLKCGFFTVPMATHRGQHWS